jgi:uncharacterized membrane protein
MTLGARYLSDPESRDYRCAALRAAAWLSLAAAPTFACMAILTGFLGSGAHEMLCSAAKRASPLTGMVLMYGLMSAFHLAPWLKLISRRRGSHCATDPTHEEADSERSRSSHVVAV